MESVMLALLLANGFQEPPAAMHRVAWEGWQPDPRSHSGVRQGVDNVYAPAQLGVPPAGTKTMTVGCDPTNHEAWTVSAVVYEDGVFEGDRKRIVVGFLSRRRTDADGFRRMAELLQTSGILPVATPRESLINFVRGLRPAYGDLSESAINGAVMHVDNVVRKATDPSQVTIDALRSDVVAFLLRDAQILEDSLALIEEHSR